MVVTLTLLNGKKLSQTFTSSEVTIGRGQKADFVINDDSLSRVHAKIELIQNEFFVTDLGSTNGVLLDGKKIPALERTPIATFLILHLGLLECHVTEGSALSNAELAENTMKNSGPIKTDDSTKVTKTLITINRAALNNPLSPRKKEYTSKSQFMITVFIVFLFLGGVIYYQFTN